VSGSIDWNALAAQAQANFNATGTWYISSPTQPASPPPAAAGVASTIGSGTDSFTLLLSEDAYLGDAQYTVSVDKVQLGGTLTAHATHGSGQDDSVTVQGTWAAGPHSVTVTFLNDAYGGTPNTDRNLYLDGATYHGAAISGATAALLSTGPAGFSFTASPPTSAPVTATIGSGTETLILLLSEDAYQGDALYTVSVDGVQIGGTLTAHASHAAHLDDTINLLGTWAPGPHSVSINFLNDAYGGTAATDRNLYLDSATFHGATVPGSTLALMSAGPAGFSFTEPGATSTPTSTTIGSGTDSITLKLSEDAYQGDAQYTVKVDGVQIGGTLSAHASHAAGQDDTLTINGTWAPGGHSVTVTFLNDAYGGTAAADRNLYLDGATFHGAAVPGSISALMSAGPATFAFTEPGSTPAPGGLVPVQPGYTLVMQDDFSAGYNHAKWGDPFPLPSANGPSSNGAYIWDVNAVGVRNNEMQVTFTHETDGWHTSGFNSFRAGIGIHFGTVDFDAKVEAAQGTVAAFLMWPVTDTWPPEIDMLETPKNQAMHTLHYGSTNADAVIQFGGPDPSQWHHYQLTWLPNIVQVTTDGVVTASWNYGIPDTTMGFGALGVVGSPADGWIGGAPDATTPPLVTIHLDNVVMAQWNGIA
jgi:hypothetical protein